MKCCNKLCSLALFCSVIQVISQSRRHVKHWSTTTLKGIYASFSNAGSQHIGHVSESDFEDYKVFEFAPEFAPEFAFPFLFGFSLYWVSCLWDPIEFSLWSSCCTIIGPFAAANGHPCWHDIGSFQATHSLLVFSPWPNQAWPRSLTAESQPPTASPCKLGSLAAASLSNFLLARRLA